MIVSDAILAALSIDLGISPNQLEIAAIKYGLSKDAEADLLTQLPAINAAAADLLSKYMILSAQSQGGFSVSLSLEGMKTLLGMLSAGSGGLFTMPAELGGKRGVRSRSLW